MDEIHERICVTSEEPTQPEVMVFAHRSCPIIYFRSPDGSLDDVAIGLDLELGIVFETVSSFREMVVRNHPLSPGGQATLRLSIPEPQ